MRVQGKESQAAWLEGTTIKAIDQRLLPHEFKIAELKNHEETAVAISDMLIRGAIIIGAFGAWGMYQAVSEALNQGGKEHIDKARETLRATRPTAQNLFAGIDYVYNALPNVIDESAVSIALEKANEFARRDLEECEKLGEIGSELIKTQAKILTHCNAGWLACLDWGTAISPIYKAHRAGKKVFVYTDETRPRLQGAKLTAWELGQEGVDHKVIADNAAGYYLKKDVDLVIVGADRIAANGDVANKIGTFEKAVLARELGVPFYVAVPLTTFDLNIKSGEEIPIEERSEDEVLVVEGKDESGKLTKVRIAPDSSSALNPAFDVTPAKYITGIITAKGIIKPNEEEIKKLF